MRRVYAVEMNNTHTAIDEQTDDDALAALLREGLVSDGHTWSVGTPATVPSIFTKGE